MDSMRRVLVFIGVGFLASALASCAPKQAGASRAVEGLLRALVERDEARFTALTCPEYESQALIEYDSFALVRAELNGVRCGVTGGEGNTSVVRCAGSIDATYDNEVRRFDLTPRIYQVLLSGGDWLVCGYTK
jgi:hypothetical protein